MTQFQNEFVTVELANNATAIALSWKGYVPSAIYREALERSLDIARKHKITNWISDIRHIKIIEDKDREWAIEEWIPKAVSADCYKRQAVIMAKDIFARASARYIISAAQNQHVEVQHFTSLEEAKEWLRPADNKASDQAAY